MMREQEKAFGLRLANLGGEIYILADKYPEVERTEDFAAMVFHLNKLAYRLIHGKERETTPRTK